MAKLKCFDMNVVYWANRFRFEIIVRRWLHRVYSPMFAILSGLLAVSEPSWSDPSYRSENQQSVILTSLNPQPLVSRPDVKAFTQTLTRNSTLTLTDIERVLSLAQCCDRSHTIMQRPPAPAQQWEKYQQHVLSPSMIQQGLYFWARNTAALKQAEQHYGMPASLIVAMIGAGSTYGKQCGSFCVLNTLVTLSFMDTPQRDFYQAQLQAFLLLTQGKPVGEIIQYRGSHCGALGTAQIMPTDALRYQQAFDALTLDRVHNETAAIRMVANTLSQLGWQHSQPILIRAKVTDRATERPFSEPIADIAASGWIPVKKAPVSKSKATGLVLLTRQNCEYWLGFDNFKVLTCYNRSQFYAPGVFKLAEALQTGHNQLALRVKSVAPWSGIT